MSKPFVGMSAHYYIKGMPNMAGAGLSHVVDPNHWSGPYAATISGINSDDTVNLQVIGEMGNTYAAQRILFLPQVNHNMAEQKMTDRYCVPNERVAVHQ